MAVMTFGTLRYASYIGHERQREAERRAKDMEALNKTDGSKGQSTAPDAAVVLEAN